MVTRYLKIQLYIDLDEQTFSYVSSLSSCKHLEFMSKFQCVGVKVSHLLWRRKLQLHYICYDENPESSNVRSSWLELVLAKTSWIKLVLIASTFTSSGYRVSISQATLNNVARYDIITFLRLVDFAYFFEYQRSSIVKLSRWQKLILCIFKEMEDYFALEFKKVGECKTLPFYQLVSTWMQTKNGI